MAKPIRVFLVDDSAVIRQVLATVLRQDPGIEVIGTAPDPIAARPKLQADPPDVIVLDIEMPRMDGLTFLKQLMAEQPTPVVICSSLTEKGAQATLQAMAAGAVGILTKPKLGLKGFLQEAAEEIIQAVKAAAGANLGRLRTAAPATRPAPAPTPAPRPGGQAASSRRVVAIGTSTGGVQALDRLLTALPGDSPGLVIVQHMPAQFTRAFADRLNTHCALAVREAQDGEPVRPGQALIAPGGRHLLLTRQGPGFAVRVKDGPLVNRHRPSVDVLFRSVAEHAGPDALGIILTGMGDDGARGLLTMREAGAATVAQDEASCVVFGMPKEAIRLGAARQVLPLDEIPEQIGNWAG